MKDKILALVILLILAGLAICASMEKVFNSPVVGAAVGACMGVEDESQGMAGTKRVVF